MRIAFVVCVAAALLGQAAPAHAVHLFPLFPGDPTGDCNAVLASDPATSEGNVELMGFFFVDDETDSSTTHISVGQSVTWTWDSYCHSVTSTTVPETAESFTTSGGPKPSPVLGRSFEPELTKAEGENATFTHTFTEAGTYEYQCVHHAAVGMTGTIVVG